MPVITPPTNALDWVYVEDSASALIRYTGPWITSGGGGGGGIERSRPAEHDARWISDGVGSVSVVFSGHEVSLIGGTSFPSPLSDIAFCTLDGEAVPCLPPIPGSRGTSNTNINVHNSLCRIIGLKDGPHVLTFNVTSDLGASTPQSTDAIDPEWNSVWIEGISFTTSKQPSTHSEPALRFARQDAPASSASSTSGSMPLASSISATPTGANNSTSSSGNSTSTPNSGSNDPGTSSKTAVRIGEIAGGIIGGALLVVALRGFFFYIQRNDGTRKAVGRPPSPEYKSGWTLPKIGKATDGAKGRGEGEENGAAQPPGERAGDVPLSQLKNETQDAHNAPQMPVPQPATF